MILYGSTLSPFVRKTLAFATEKGLTLELVPAGMGRGGPGFAEASPLGKMPGFRDPGGNPDGSDFAISDSSAIIHYLEAKFPEPNLIPADPAGRARAVWFDEFGDTIVGKIAGACFFNRVVAPHVLKIPGDETVAAAALANDLPPALDYLERIIPASGFLLEDRITLADVAVAAPFVNLAHVGEPVDAARWPRTAAYLDGILARSSFAPVVAEERRFLASLG